MIERVRAVLVTPGGCLLVIRRDRPGRATYWVLPGGYVIPATKAWKPRSAGRSAARRTSPACCRCWTPGQVASASNSTFGRITSWDFAARTGPEFSEPGHGTYPLEQIQLTAAGLGVIDLQPAAVAGLLRDAIAEGRDLFTLPDLRSVSEG